MTLLISIQSVVRSAFQMKVKFAARNRDVFRLTFDLPRVDIHSQDRRAT